MGDLNLWVKVVGREWKWNKECLRREPTVEYLRVKNMIPGHWVRTSESVDHRVPLSYEKRNAGSSLHPHHTLYKFIFFFNSTIVC